jgi:hypothetical protein
MRSDEKEITFKSSNPSLKILTKKNNKAKLKPTAHTLWCTTLCSALSIVIVVVAGPWIRTIVHWRLA